MSEGELEIFDLLKKDKMTQEETLKVRFAAKSLLHRLLEEHPKVLVQDWYKARKSRSRCAPLSRTCWTASCRKATIVCCSARNATTCLT
uniref:Uncharacterized protein n=1 Tax=Candidatus Nitrotoga fabula TaxID=2182327 RepID=A0A2X0QVI4_9PROT|nr:protein of unknown function [Candidatus Nitrotoga fabula]